MKNLVISMVVLLIAFQSGTTAQQRWVAGYWTNWDHTRAGFQELLEQNTFTHIFHFALGTDANGNIYEDYTHPLTQARNDLIPLGHAAGVKIIMTTMPSQAELLGAMAPATRLRYINSLMNVIRSIGYDGIDFDYEFGFTPTLQTYWNATMTVLRDSMNVLSASLGKPLYLTLFTFGYSWNDYYASSTFFDRICLAGYEMTGPWSGWMVWHGYGLYSRNQRAPGDRDQVIANMDSLWTGWVRRGVPSSKLMISGAASGCVWAGGVIVGNTLGLPTHGGATQPGDDYNGGSAPSMVADQAYNGLMTTYAAYPTLHDTLAVAAYKSIDNPGSADDRFISFDDPWTWWKKWRYMRYVRSGGGLVMWTVWRGRMGTNKWPLLDALKLSISDSALPSEPRGTFTATPSTLPLGGGAVRLTWKSQNARSALISGVGGVALNGSTTVNISGSAILTLTLSNSIYTTIFTDTVMVTGRSNQSSFSDNFNRVNGTLGSNWTTSMGSPAISSNVVTCSASGATFAYWSSSSFSDDQFSKGNPTGTAAGGRYVYFGVRMGANGQGYFIKTDGANSWIVYRPSGGAEQTLQTLNTGFLSTDVGEIRAIGATLSAYKNGFQIGVNQTSSVLSSGYPGIGVSPDNNTTADNWQGGGYGKVPPAKR
jgi:hypothetical protein